MNDSIALNRTTTIASITRPRRLYITSLLKESYEAPYRFTARFRNAIQGCKGVRLLSAQINLNCYNFHDKYSQVTFKAVNNNYSLTMPKQQYNTPQEVADKLNYLFQNAVADSLFSCTWNASTLRYTIACSNANGAFYQGFFFGPNSIWKKLGFTPDQAIPSVNFPLSITATNSPTLVRTSCIYINSPTVSTNEGITNISSDSTFERKNILAAIPVQNGHYGSYQMFNESIDIYRAVQLNESLQGITFELLDDELELLDDLDGSTIVNLELDLEYT